MNAYELLRRPVLLLDLETTGLNPDTDRVIEVAAIRVDEHGRQVLATVVCPHPVPTLSEEVTRLTGITQQMVAAGRPDAEVFARLWVMAHEAVIVGHNVSFDLSFLQAEFRRLGLTEWEGDWICTRALATFLRIGKESVNRAGYPYISYKLGDVCEAMGIKLEGAHRALNDLEATEQVLLQLVPMALNDHRPIYNAMVRPRWVQEQIDDGIRPPEYEPPGAVVYLVA
ncbi:3'-5' exonuclease [Symbiobacterium terraclitae]|uniref:3'-5' exonuclease n=1 Tax=Symbiobacterium terraclitae TaxID=557451 RepID=UPI0035B51C18